MNTILILNNIYMLHVLKRFNDDDSKKGHLFLCKYKFRKWR